MNETMTILPKWMRRDRVSERRRYRDSGTRDVTILNDLNGVKVKLEMTVKRLESMLDDEQGEQ